MIYMVFEQLEINHIWFFYAEKFSLISDISIQNPYTFIVYYIEKNKDDIYKS